MANSSSNKTQLERFKEAARELEADDDEAKFNKKLRKIVNDRSRPKPDSNDSDDKA